MLRLSSDAASHIAPLRPGALLNRASNPGGACSMLDILLIVLGTGGILLMVAYAALCERI